MLSVQLSKVLSEILIVQLIKVPNNSWLWMGPLYQFPTIWGSKTFTEVGTGRLYEPGNGGKLCNSDFWAWPGCCTHKLTVSVLTVTSLHKIKPVKIYTMAWGQAKVPPLQESYWSQQLLRGESLFFRTQPAGKLFSPSAWPQTYVHKAVLIRLRMLLITIKKRAWSWEGDDRKAQGAGEQ